MDVQFFIQRLRRLLPYFIILISLFAGCKSPTDSTSLSDPPMGNYFQVLRLGDTSQWDFVQYTHPTMSAPVTTWTGKMRWKVIAIDSTSGTRRTTIERILSGSWIMVAGIPRDSGIIAADTSYFTVDEDSNHKISFNLAGKSKAITYGGVSANFDRYQPLIIGEKVELDIRPVVSGYLVRISLQKDLGMVKYYSSWTGGITGWYCTYTLVQ